MVGNAYKRGGLIKSAMRVHMNQGRQEATWTQAEMEEIIRRERAVRQQAQLAAEQALKAAKEAQKMILQLEEELDTKDQQLQQERAARQQAELAAQKAAQSAVRVVLEDVQDETITTIRETSEKQKSQSKCNAMVPKTEDEAALGAPIDASASAKLPQPKRAREEVTKTQSPSTTKKLKVEEKPSQDKTSQKKMSLAEARKAARGEVERRAQERAKALEAMKTD
ncbi:hypothetical protein PC118_g3453 [Phytophthora cactorum]|uniref:Uncharacterized protein n=2 Tax=Phytophthora cactorum TaxID=29920 RepID=A0A8T0ZPY0_9STRA|nr:hypothetical protein PC112_g4154 [Phytophthora cactorum]KAG2841460.1 hypothetical protein PC111_g3098 [Phytophthora cactorum]KAG2864489.1 hypothetical protein PC113_g4557 [Phytophthora cactorum]KAG2938536.1 hypothetical protein PC115_g3721 [Phytophthora cactorum]KAG2994553.1 hypothetical protein PC118_g3453 [Phytophthora cactorum]